ncbi:MAG TPA: hypothetical protein VGN34_11230, partial [Ktedonobacteraceae bacterium]
GLLSNSAMIPYEPSHAETSSHALNKNALTRITAPGVSVPFSSDPDHSEQIVATLACLVPEHHTPIERIIETEENMFPSGEQSCWSVRPQRSVS